MESKVIMPIVHVQHAIFIEVPVELPTSCPHCHAWFEDEDENNLVELRLQMVQGRTCLVIGTDQLKEVPNGYDEADADGPGVLVGFGCASCKEPVIWTHTRTWILEDMELNLASQFKTLLYDNNVLDDFIKKKVFG
jgi:hypothetical protein